MTVQELSKKFEISKDREYAKQQEKYLKNQFNFLGIPKSKRAELEKDFIKSFNDVKADEIIDTIATLHKMKYREYMYTAQQLGIKNIKKFNYKHICKLISLTKINPWWENTDGYVMVIKRWLNINPKYIRILVDDYYQNDNFWIRRLTIICQLSLKEKTNFSVMKKAFEYSIYDDEFFIQKAIGWALREYSKTEPEVVRNYIEKNESRLSNLAKREGMKIILK